MTAHPRRPPTDGELLALLEDEVTASQRADLEAALAEHPAARARLGALHLMLEALRAAPAEIARIDLSGEILERVAREARAPARPSRWRSRRGLALAGAAAAAVALAAVGRGGASDPAMPDDGVRVKRAAAPGSRAHLDVALRVFVVDPTGAPIECSSGDTIAPDAELVFAYQNGGDPPAGHLLVFGVDAAGRMHWYYADGAGGIAIRASSMPVELPDAIRQDLSPGRLTVHAWFAPGPLSVAAVEAWRRDGRTPLDVEAIELPFEVRR